MNNRRDICRIDSIISNLIPERYKNLLGISNELVQKLNQRGTSFNNALQELLIARDKKVLGLRDCKISQVKVKDLQLNEEFIEYNEILQNDRSGEITVVQAKDKDEKNNILYYYMTGWSAERQQRIFNEYGDIESIDIHSIWGEDYTSQHIDDALIEYKYDKYGNKEEGLYKCDFGSMKYIKYDKEGNVKWLIESQHNIRQKHQENGNSYWICEGYITPAENDFFYKNIGTISAFELKPEDMQRVVVGDVSPETRKALMDDMDARRKKEVLSILRETEPIFESGKIANKLDKSNIKRAENMNNKVDARVIDERIRQAFQNKDPKLIEDLIDLSTFEGTQIWNRLIGYGKISAGLLQEILIARDKKVLGLKNCEISTVYAGELKLDKEFASYNDIPEESEVTVVQGKDQNGKNNILYYYADYENDWANRQQRIFNEYGDIESLCRQTMFSSGRCEHIDDAVIVYQYDKHGNKKMGLYQGDLEGMKYFEYDKAGNIKLEIGEEYIQQEFQENGNTYGVTDGYFVPTDNGYIYTFAPKFELKPEDMQRYIYGDVSPKTRKALMESMDAERKKEVLSTLKAVEPIFESCKAANKLDEANIKKMQKCVQWFTSFVKRLEINPKLVVQDDAVMSTMRAAVGKTIGNTRNAEMELKTPVKEEIREKERGNN